MKHAIIKNGNPVYYTERFFIDASGVQYPLRAMDQAAKLALGVYEVQEDYTVPEGFRSVGRALEFDPVADVVREVPVLEEIPASEIQKQLERRVTAEASRRIEKGKSFSVPGIPNPIPVPGTPDYIDLINAKFGASQVFKAQGVTDPIMLFRDKTNINHMLTPDQMLSLCLQAMQWYEATRRVSWDMKDGVAPFLDGIPADFAEDKHWP